MTWPGFVAAGVELDAVQQPWEADRGLDRLCTSGEWQPRQTAALQRRHAAVDWAWNIHPDHCQRDGRCQREGHPHHLTGLPSISLSLPDLPQCAAAYAADYLS